MDTISTSNGLTYRDTGVDISAGNRLVEAIKPIAKQTHRPGVLNGIGGFAGLFELPIDRYQKPVLVSATDGVGTKLKLAIDYNQHDGIGIDLVAMCANDLIVCGAEPLYFLDYYATGKLNVEAATIIINSIGVGCKLAETALLGGETAEMPGMYNGNDYDLAGFCVGVVEKERIIDGSQVSAGDQLIALASSGPHANGYSLIRRILADQPNAIEQNIDGIPLIQRLLEPTKIYVTPIRQCLDQFPIHAMAHITGGGLLENIPRVLPDTLAARINCSSWQLPAIFEWLQQSGQIAQEEMWRTFNCGIGMVLCVAASDAAAVVAQLQQAGENAWVCGDITQRSAQTVEIIA